MSISTESSQGEPASPAKSEPSAGGSLLGGAAGDRCAVCEAQLAIDQRYCVECGTRRGSPRFQLANAAVGEPSKNAGPSASAAATAVTRIQLLLALLVVAVAIGVGVLIGQGTATRTTTTVRTASSLGALLSSGSGAKKRATSTSARRSGASGPAGGSGGSGGNLFSSGG